MNGLKEKSILETESSSIRSHSPKNSFGPVVNVMMMMMMMIMMNTQR